MAEEEKSRKRLPPYVPYTTFKNFIERMRSIGLPGRIDRSVMSNYSGGTQSQLDLALLYLGLIQESKEPTERLKLIATAGEAEWLGLLGKVMKARYTFIFANGLDLENATSQQVYEKFTGTGASGDTARKAMAFFISAAKDTGLPVSPHIQVTKGGAVKSGAVRKKKRERPLKGAGDTTTNANGAQTSELSELQREKIAKFPEFNPDWPAEVQQLWYENFHKVFGSDE